MDDATRAAASGLQHAAMLYRSPADYAAGVASLVRTGAPASDVILVAAPWSNLGFLQARLYGQDERVTWADMGAVGLNPARLIGMIRAFADEHPTHPVSCVQEPAWPSRSPAELREVIRHEALVNLAPAAGPVRVCCAYDVRLGPELIAAVERTHPIVIRGGQWQASSSYAGDGLVPEECDRPLSPPPPDAEVLSYLEDLVSVRGFAASRARRAGLPPHRVGDLVIAVSELAANTLAHADGRGELTMWITDGEVICQVHDAGRITNPLAGRLRPDRVAAGGYGLWVVNQACDLVEPRTGPAGTTVRLHMRLGHQPTR